MTINLSFDWKTYSWVKRGNRRIKVLQHLAKSSKPLTATDVKKVQQVDITQTAFTLNELLKKGLVDCFNPEDHHGKLYVINKKGKQILSKIHKD